MYNEEEYLESEKLIGEVFKSSPEFSLPYGFADKMAKMAGRRMAIMQLFQEFLIYMGALAGLAAVVVGIMLIWFPAHWVSGIQFVLSNLSIIIGVFFLLVFIVFADRFLLRYFLYRSSGKIN